MTITPNGTGNVVMGTEIIDNVKAKLNTNLTIQGNGTGVVNFGTNGFKFANEALNLFTSNSFTTAFTFGTFSTGNLTIKYQRIGSEVTLKFPAFTGTPASDGIWTSGSIPAIVTPITTQFIRATAALRDGTQKLPLIVEITSGGIIILGLVDGTVGLGNTSTCGWQNAFAITYDLN